MRQLPHLLLLAATSALQALAPRRAAPVLAPPTADLVLIDGDNVRGKTAFAVSAQSLLAQTGIEANQLKNWFSRARRRIWKPLRSVKR